MQTMYSYSYKIQINQLKKHIKIIKTYNTINYTISRFSCQLVRKVLYKYNKLLLGVGITQGQKSQVA